MTNNILPGYLTLNEAIQLSAEAWELENHDDAWLRLSGYLYLDQIQASGITEIGLIPIKPGIWGQHRSSDTAYVPQTMPVDSHKMFIDEGIPVILKRDLDKLIGSTCEASDLIIQKENLISENNTPKRGGRPPNPAWADYASEAVLIVHDQGLPETQEELLRQLLESPAGGKDGGMPRATLQPLVKLIFEKMKPKT